jgi:hypothetical protein
MGPTSPIYKCAPLLTLVAVLAGCGGTPARQGESTSSPAASSPVATTNADGLAAESLRVLQVERDPRRALDLIARASQAAPARPDLVWLHSRLCMEVKQCKAEPIEARLRELAPKNAAGWIGALQRAQAARDTAIEVQVLDSMSYADRFDVYWNELLWRLATAAVPSGAASAQGPDPLTRALEDTTVRLTAVVIPALQLISVGCNADRTTQPAMAQRCARLAQVLQRGDSFLAEGVGLGLSKRLAPPASREAFAIEQRITAARYRNETAISLRENHPERAKFSAELIELLKQVRREQDVADAVLRWAGQPLQPPG